MVEKTVFKKGIQLPEWKTENPSSTPSYSFIKTNKSWGKFFSLQILPYGEGSVGTYTNSILTLFKSLHNLAYLK